MSIQQRALMMMVVASLTLPFTTAAQSKPAANPQEQQVLQAEKDRFAAMLKPDPVALGRLLADDLTYTHTSALFQTKTEFINDLKSGTIKYLSIAPSASDWKVRVYGNTAVVNGVANIHVIDPAKNDLTFKVRYTTVHTNRLGAWQMVAWQATRFPQ